MSLEWGTHPFRSGWICTGISFPEGTSRQWTGSTGLWIRPLLRPYPQPSRNLLRMEKGMGMGELKCLVDMVRPAGLEPAACGFEGG